MSGVVCGVLGVALAGSTLAAGAALSAAPAAPAPPAVALPQQFTQPSPPVRTVTQTVVQTATVTETTVRTSVVPSRVPPVTVTVNNSAAPATITAVRTVTTAPTTVTATSIATTTTPTTVTVTPTPTGIRYDGAAPNTTGRLGRYLAGKLVNGTHVETTRNGRTAVDYDATADVVFALRSLGEQPAAMRRASHFLLTKNAVRAYVNQGRNGVTLAEPAAKIVLIGSLMSRDGLVTQTEVEAASAATTALSGRIDSTGKVSDQGVAKQTDSVQRQTWAGLALAATGDAAARNSVLGRLAGAQCRDGGFPAVITGRPCAAGNPAATGFAMTALATVPSSWANADRRLETGRAQAMNKASRMLSGITPNGLVRGSNKLVDLPTTAAVVAARQLSGLDTKVAAGVVSELGNRDGGFSATPTSPPKTPAASPRPQPASQIGPSVAAATILAGHSWVVANNSPLAQTAWTAQGGRAAQPQATPGSPTPVPPTVVQANESGSTRTWLLWAVPLLVALLGAAGWAIWRAVGAGSKPGH